MRPPRLSTFLACGCAWIVGFAWAPTVTIAATLMFWVLTRWPDRALGWTTAAAWTAPAVAMWLWSDDHGPDWLYIQTGWGPQLSDGQTAAWITGFTYGPWVAAISWLVLRRHPEDNELRRRTNTENARRRWLKSSLTASRLPRFLTATAQDRDRE